MIAWRMHLRLTGLATQVPGPTNRRLQLRLADQPGPVEKSAPFHVADSRPDNRRLRLRLVPNRACLAYRARRGGPGVSVVSAFSSP